MMSMQILAPIILFLYNRPEHALRTIEALKKNNLAKESELFIFCDGPKNKNDLEKIHKVYEVIDAIDGFKNITIQKAPLNKGCANSVIAGISEVIEKYGKVIVLEDDIVTSSNFLEFMNDALDFYQEDKNIFTVTGFNFPNYAKPKKYLHDIFFIKGRSSSWGWGMWRDRWRQVDFLVKDYDVIASNKKIQKKFIQGGANLFCMLKDQVKGKIDTWDIQVTYTMFKTNSYCVFPIKTLVKNIGFDSSGMHCHVDHSMANFDFDDNQEIKLVKINEVVDNKLAEKQFLKFFQDRFFIKLFSKKKKLRLKYILIGFLLAQILNFFINL